MKKVIFLTALVSTVILTAFTFFPKDPKVIIIDIGHGGKDPGAHVEHVVEKDVNLKIAEKIISQNENENIKLLISRNGDEFKSIEDRVAFANNNNADLFISIHSNYKNDPDVSGIELYHGMKNNSKELAEHFKSHLSKNHKIHNVLAARFNVLNDVECPSIMIETGFLSNAEDRERLTSEEGQTALAKAILAGLE